MLYHCFCYPVHPLQGASNALQKILACCTDEKYLLDSIKVATSCLVLRADAGLLLYCVTRQFVTCIIVLSGNVFIAFTVVLCLIMRLYCVFYCRTSVKTNFPLGDHKVCNWTETRTQKHTMHLKQHRCLCHSAGPHPDLWPMNKQIKIYFTLFFNSKCLCCLLLHCTRTFHKWKLGLSSDIYF